MTKFLTRPILAAQIIRAMSPSQVEQQESEGVLSCIPHFLDANALQFAPSNDSNDPQTLLPKLPKRTPMACQFCRGLALCTHILTQLIIMYPHFAGGSLRHPSCVAAVQHSFTEINLYRGYLLHNFSSIYAHSRRRDVQAICIMCLPPQFLYSRIIVKIWIKTPIFSYILLNAISPHPNL